VAAHDSGSPTRRKGPAETRPSQTRRNQEERSTETRRKLVEAAIAVVEEAGYANLTISKVAERAGLTNGAMQHHFSSRGDLLLAVLDALYPVMEIPFERIAERKLPLRDRVGMLVDALWQIYSRPEYLAIWDIAFGTRRDPILHPRLRAYQGDLTTRTMPHLTVLFADIGLSEAAAGRVFLLIIRYLRGVALQTVFGVDRRQADLDQIKEIACEQIIRSAGKGS
jgi:AcrR family transcriptional regulator